MKKLWSLLWISTFIMMLIFTACSNQQLTDAEIDPEGELELSLDKEYGGYNTTDEAAAFGDTEIIENFPEDVMVTDAISVEPEVLEALNSDKVKAYFLRITWGYLEGDSTVTESTDWSGSAEINKGTLVLLKTIRFEGNDYIHLPRESRQKIDFTSFTKPHFDGLALAIIDNDTTQDDLDGTFTLTAGGYSTTLNYSQLDSLELIEDVSTEGQQVSIVSRSKEIVPFAGGFLSGRWIKTGADGGIFKGRWINSLGTNAGHLRGIWGINRFGNKVFKGKYISLNGEFRGLLAGQWTYKQNDNKGYFQGHWVDRNYQTGGTLKGHFKTGRPGDKRGFFQGRYKKANKKAN